MRAALVIDARDNVATALRVIEPGDEVLVGARAVVALDRIPAGHKIATADIPAGMPVVKYGSPIGLAIADINAGAHVHTHNLASTRGRGDLAPAPGGRLAEPDDEGTGDAATVKAEGPRP